MNESTISSAPDLDHDTARPRRDDLLRQIVLQRHCHPVVHVDLDRDQQTIADPHDRNVAHSCYSCGKPAGAGRATIVLPRPGFTHEVPEVENYVGNQTFSPQWHPSR